MAGGGSSPARAAPVLVILDNAHAMRVRKAVHEFETMSHKGNPRERRFYAAVVKALQLVHNRPDGWYDSDLKVRLHVVVRPVLSTEEMTEVMNTVYTVVPLRIEDERIKQLRETRKQQVWRQR